MIYSCSRRHLAFISLGGIYDTSQLSVKPMHNGVGEPATSFHHQDFLHHEKTECRHQIKKGVKKSDKNVHACF